MNLRNVIAVSASVLAFAACGSTEEKSSNPVIITGTADMGGTGQDVGNNGSGSDAGTVDPDGGGGELVCERFGERPVDGVCERVARYVQAFAATSRANDPDRNSNTVRVCLLQATGETAPVGGGWDIEAGNCHAQRLGGATTNNPPAEFEVVAESVGEVTFTTPSGPVVLDPPTADFACYSAPSDVELNPGDTVGLSISGAGPVPAFETDISVPQLVRFEASTPTPGQPLSVTWTPTGVDNVSFYFQYSKVEGNELVGIFGFCDFEDTGSGEVPAEIMAEMPDAPENVIGQTTARTQQNEFLGDTLFYVSGSATYESR